MGIELPAKWTKGLTDGKKWVARPQAAITSESANAWLSERPKADGQPCKHIAKTIADAVVWLATQGKDGAYDYMTGAVWGLVRDARVGHQGIRSALAALERAYLAETAERGRDNAGEWRRSLEGAIAKTQADGVEPEREDPCSWDLDNWRSHSEEDDEEQAVREATRRTKIALRANAAARRELFTQGWSAPEDDGSLEDQFRNPAEDPGFLVAGLIPAEGIVQINAQWKAGKTTLASVNLASDLAAGKPFLDSYPVIFPDGNIGIWNLEVSASLLQRWLFARGLPPSARRRIFPKHLRGTTVDLLSDVVADWVVDWLRSRDIKVWIIDPLSKLYHGKENDNTEFNAWWKAMEEIARRAGVRVVVIVHHAGHSSPAEGDAKPRSRGASAMLGNPDVVVSYRHGGNLGEAPPDSRRYLSAFGRDVDFAEITLDFKPTEQRLYRVDGSGGRQADRIEALARCAAWEVHGANGRINAGELKVAMGGGKASDKVAGIKRAVDRQWIKATPEGRTIWHEPGAVDFTRIVLRKASEVEEE